VEYGIPVPLQQATGDQSHLNAIPAGRIEQMVVDSKKISVLVALAASILGLQVVGVRWGDLAPGNHLAKRDEATQGALELEKAVQAFKNAILRGESSYSTAFLVHMDGVDRAIDAYAGSGNLNTFERIALEDLHKSVPQYRAALATVAAMRARQASPEEIDAAVKGADRPVYSAFEELRVAGDLDRETRTLPNLSWIEMGQILLAFLMAALTTFWFLRARQPRVAKQDWAEMSRRAIQWEESKNANASSLLLDQVTQSLQRMADSLGEQGRSAPVESNQDSGSASASVMGSLRGAISDLHAIARELHVPRLQGLGLLDSLAVIWSDHRAGSPGFEVETHMPASEQDIPVSLKPAILRIAQLSLEWAAQEPAVMKLLWVLARKGDAVRLSLQVVAGEGEPGSPEVTPPQQSEISPADAIKAWIALSGGYCTSAEQELKPLAILAKWSAVDGHTSKQEAK
jgi:hypothetical protein